MADAAVLASGWLRAERIRGLWRAAGMPLALVLVSAWLLRLAVPPDPVAPAAWIALVPLVLSLRGRSPGAAALIGFGFGVASLAAMHTWFLSMPGVNLLNASALFAYLSVYPALWCALLGLLMRRRMAWVLPGAVLWVLVDWLRGHAGPFALPWDPLAHSQIDDVPLMQLAALGGAPLVSLAVCLTNLALARAWEKRDIRVAAWAAGIFAAAHLYGVLRIPPAAPAPAVRIAILQPADGAVPGAAKLDLLREMTRSAAREQPDLVVWPESAVDRYEFNPALRRAVAEVVRQVDVPILFGSADFGKFAKSAGANDGTQFKNQAYLVFPDGSRQGPYVKRQLVPFGEFMPFERQFVWPRWLVPRQLHGIAGRTPGIFRLKDGTVLGVVICWENYFARLSDALVRAGAGLVVQLSDDSDFGASAEPAQHNAATALRAVETGRSWVQVSANGPSFFVDAYGRNGTQLGPVGAARWGIGAVPVARTRTPYERFGLLWFWLSAIAVSAQFAVVLIRSSHSAEV